MDYREYKYLSKKYKIKIINCRTVRDKNKVALSSRNFLLSKYNLHTAGLVAKYLINLKPSIKKNNILSQIKNELENKYSISVEYLELRDLHDLKTTKFKKKYRLFIAYYINNIRIIDNF